MSGETVREVLRFGHAVQYLSCHTGFACFQAITGVADRLLRSTTTPECIAFWATAESATAWLQSIGYRPGDAVPIGVGHMTIGVRPFASDLVDPEWCRGSLFEVPKSFSPQSTNVSESALSAPEPALSLPLVTPAFGPYGLSNEGRSTASRSSRKPAHDQLSLF